MFGFVNKVEIQKLKEEIEVKDAYILTLERRLGKKKRTRRKDLRRAKGIKKVTEEESMEIYEMFKAGKELIDISEHFHRSQSCVATHIRKYYEKRV